MPKTYEELLGFKKMQKVAKERLHPPMAPIASEKSVPKPEEAFYKTDKEFIGEPTPTDSKLAINLGSMPTEYWQYCDCNDAKRNWIRVKFGMSHRGTTAQLKRDVKKISDNMEFINKNQAVINEFKAKVKKLQEKRVE